MLRSLVKAGAARRGWRRLLYISSPSSKFQNISFAVDTMILRSLKDHYVEISTMNTPPKVSPPSAFEVIKGALDGDGPVLSKAFGSEEIKISVMRLPNIVAGGVEDDETADLNQLVLLMEVSKPQQEKSLHFLCGLYLNALAIHGLSLRPKLDQLGFLMLLPSIVAPSSGILLL